MEHGLRIGEAARAAGLNAKTIRYYEGIGLIPPPRRREGGYASQGHRLFAQEDIQRLIFIKRARMLDLSLDQIKELLASVQMGCCGSARPQLKVFLEAKLQEVEQRIVELNALRQSLQRLYQDISGEVETCSPRATASECVFGEGLVSIHFTSPSHPTLEGREEPWPSVNVPRNARQKDRTRERCSS